MSLQIGDSAPDFELLGTDGKHHSLGEHSGKKAIAIIFSCNHCPYVCAWESRMVQIQSDYGGKGVQVIAINANNAESHPNDSFAHMQSHYAEQGFNFLYLRDESQTTAKAYGAERTPEVYLFDQNRKLSYHGAIDDNYDNPDAVQSPYLRDAIESVLSGQTPKTPQSKAVGCTIKWK